MGRGTTPAGRVVLLVLMSKDSVIDEELAKPLPFKDDNETGLDFEIAIVLKGAVITWELVDNRLDDVEMDEL
jgi:hypothetical protein